MRVSSFTLSVVILAMPFAAQARVRTAHAAIMTGDYRQAEQTLIAERKIFPNEPELLLNLAAVYQFTNRAAEARALYDSVLKQPNVEMEISAERASWSHAIARAGLSRLSGVQLSSR